MPLFLVTCVCDEGMYAHAFRVVEAPSRLAVAAYIRQHPYRWEDFLRRSGLWEAVRDGQWSAEALLKRIDATRGEATAGTKCLFMQSPPLSSVDRETSDERRENIAD